MITPILGFPPHRDDDEEETLLAILYAFITTIDRHTLLSCGADNSLRTDHHVEKITNLLDRMMKECVGIVLVNLYGI